MAEKNAVTTQEELKRKERVRTRLFIILIIFDVLLVAYLAYEMISIFLLRKSG